MGHSLVGALALLVAPAAAGDVAVDVNRPRSPFEMRHPDRRELVRLDPALPRRAVRNLQLTNEWLFVDDHKRRHRHPCYGRHPTWFEGQ